VIPDSHQAKFDEGAEGKLTRLPQQPVTETGTPQLDDSCLEAMRILEERGCVCTCGQRPHQADCHLVQQALWLGQTAGEVRQGVNRQMAIFRWVLLLLVPIVGVVLLPQHAERVLAGYSIVWASYLVSYLYRRWRRT